ncbi:MAG: hypothetical protein KAT65_27000 [Methanophagales archaeon]|nr:hypothetical protein [Methanophagales archaeon]
MKRKTIVGLIAIVAVVAVAMFAGCVEEKAPTPTPMPVTEQVKEYSNLKITEVTYENGQVKVFGITDLPGGAVLMMQLDAPTGLCAQGKSKVENGEFTMTFGPFKEPYDFDTKPYEVSALLTPVNQPDSVSRLVGEKGEHLTGDLVTYASFAGNILETKREFNTQQAFPTEYPMIDTTSYATGTPERLMAEWLSCWKQEEWGKMFNLTSKTWRGDEKLPELFEVDYYSRKLLGAEIIEKDTDFENEVTFKIRIYYVYVGTTTPKEKVFFIDVVRESAPYTLSSTGDWSVDPDFV